MTRETIRRVLRERLTRALSVFFSTILAFVGVAAALTITTLTPQEITLYDQGFEDSDFVMLNMTTTFSSTGGGGGTQIGRPNSTIDSGAFSVVGAATHHEAIDEVVPNDDTDYTVSGTNGDELIVGLNVTDPEGAAGTYILRCSVKAFGSGGKERFQMVLYQGVTLVASSGGENGDRTQYVAMSHIISQGEVDQITDYSNLRMGIRIISLGSGETIRITQCEFELPGSSATVDTITIDVVLKNMNSTSSISADVTTNLFNSTGDNILGETQNTGSVAVLTTVSLVFIFSQENLIAEFYSTLIAILDD